MTRLVQCDHAAESCPDRCTHKLPHKLASCGVRATFSLQCRRGICGGEYVECQPVKGGAK